MIGIDIIEIQRFVDMDINLLINKVFTDNEAAYIRSKHNTLETLAGLYALKEAVVKALGCGINENLKNIEVSYSKLGQPTVSLTGQYLQLLHKLGYNTVNTSISHTNITAVAVAILSK